MFFQSFSFQTFHYSGGHPPEDLYEASGSCPMGDQYSLFFYTMQSCAGDEIGWDFISAVKSSKISFTDYCNQMTRMYKTMKEDSDPFMSPKTFISWVFAWLSAFKIDFRKEVDLYCKYTPRMLACDGTHIGVSIRHLQLEKPVTKNDVDAIVPWRHGQILRLLFQDDQVPTHLKYMCLEYLNRLNPDGSWRLNLIATTITKK